QFPIDRGIAGLLTSPDGDIALEVLGTELAYRDVPDIRSDVFVTAPNNVLYIPLASHPVVLNHQITQVRNRHSAVEWQPVRCEFTKPFAQQLLRLSPLFGFAAFPVS